MWTARWLRDKARLRMFWFGLVLGVTVASLGEYWAHRLMHRGHFLGDVHRAHHAEGTGGGVLRELRDYVRGGLPIALALGAFLAWLVSQACGAAFVLGAALFGCFAAYAHQLQHDNPAACFWLSMPVHYTHHKHGMWEHNFGIAVDLWDRVFGTYRREPWYGEGERARKVRGMLGIRWW